MADLVILDSLAENLLVYETGQVDTLVWDTIEFVIIAGIDLCDLIGMNSAISVIGETVAVDLIGEMFSIFIDAAHLRFDGIGVLFASEFTAVKSVASLLSYFSWLNSDAQKLSNVVESAEGEFIAIASKLDSEIAGEGQKIDVYSEPHEC